MGSFYFSGKLPICPSPKANINTYFSLRAKCWLREGVAGQLPRKTYNDPFFVGVDRWGRRQEQSVLQAMCKWRINFSSLCVLFSQFKGICPLSFHELCVQMVVDRAEEKSSLCLSGQISHGLNCENKAEICTSKWFNIFFGQYNCT